MLMLMSLVAACVALIDPLLGGPAFLCGVKSTRLFLALLLGAGWALLIGWLFQEAGRPQPHYISIGHALAGAFWGGVGYQVDAWMRRRAARAVQ